MYCRECGSHISDNAKICTNCGVRPLNSSNYCPSCGTPTKEQQEICTHCGTQLHKEHVGNKTIEDKPEILLNVVSCCFPLVGLILFLVWRDTKPKSAKSVCLWAVIGSVLMVLIYIILFVFGLFTALWGNNQGY